jgi:hypothetical protein
MPLLDIKTLKLDKAAKDRIAMKMYKEVGDIIKIPSIEVYFNEYDSFYLNGEAATKNFVTVFFDGPELPQEMITQMCAVTFAVIKEVLGDSCSQANFACRGSKHTHVGHGGKLLAELFGTWNK